MAMHSETLLPKKRAEAILQKILTTEGLKPAQLAQQIGVTPQLLYMRESTTYFSQDFLTSLYYHYPSYFTEEDYYQLSRLVRDTPSTTSLRIVQIITLLRKRKISYAKIGLLTNRGPSTIRDFELGVRLSHDASFLALLETLAPLSPEQINQLYQEARDL